MFERTLFYLALLHVACSYSHFKLALYNFHKQLCCHYIYAFHSLCQILESVPLFGMLLIFNLSSFRINESFTKLSFHFPTIIFDCLCNIVLLQIIFITYTWKHLTLIEHIYFIFTLVLFGWMDGRTVKNLLQNSTTDQHRKGYE